MNDSKKEVMLILQEECAEVTQAISKCLRFGIDGEYNGATNRERLTEEIGDLIAMIELCYDTGIVDYLQVKEAQHRKFDKLKEWSTIYEQVENI
jgi:NTP pyrophosphatase (non-canonical NTP hydrolase)